MIKSITLKDVATFPVDGVTINNLQPINYFYGANGSGKTTISNFIKDQASEVFREKGCAIEWVDNSPLPCLVYNKKFREENFSQDDIAGVFTLGAATKEDLEAIRLKEDELAILKVRLKAELKKKEGLEGQLAVENTNFENSCYAALYKKYETEFKEAFRGYMKPKKAFATKLLDEFGTNSAEIRTYEYLNERAVVVFGPTPMRIEPLTLLNFGRINAIELSELWRKKIVGSVDVPIAKLIRELRMDDWVNTGRGYVRENAICPFCQEPTLTDNIKGQLDKFFDKEYTQALEYIRRLKQEYVELSRFIEDYLNSVKRREQEQGDTKLDLPTFDLRSKVVVSESLSNQEIIASKLLEPSREFTVKSLQQERAEIEKMLVDANAKIKEHNELIDGIESAKHIVKSEIWRFLIELFRTEIDLYIKKRDNYVKQIRAGEQKCAATQKEIAAIIKALREMRQNVTSVQPTVDEINRLLKSYDFNSFSISPSPKAPNRYQIQRANGELAEDSLSEGEMTFITFLYFMQRAKGGLKEDIVKEDLVMVVDDPISSLDSNVLFIVSTMIKDVIRSIKQGNENVKQILVLTHNVYFHKEVTYLSARENASKDGLSKTHFWVVRKKGDVSEVQPYLKKNPVSTTYELLWSELRGEARISTVTLQNTMRRILENYFKMMGDVDTDDLVEMFEKHEDKLVCRSLISWINAGSHDDSDDMHFSGVDDIEGRYRSVFEKIFEQADHHGHYKMMMSRGQETVLTA